MLATVIPSPRFVVSNTAPLPRTIRLHDSVQRTNPLEHRDWDAQFVAHENFSFFHSAAWAKVLSETYGHKPHYFSHNQESLLPLMEVDSWLTGRRAVALPFTDDCEPLCPDIASFKKLFAAAAKFGKSRGWKFLELRGGRNFLETALPSVSFYGHSVSLNATEEELFSRLESSTRRAVRKAEKDGVVVEISRRLDTLLDFYSLQCKTRKKHGLPPQSFNFFRNLHKHVLSRNAGMIVLARHNKIPVAGAIFFQSGDRAIFKYGASDDSFQHLRGANLVMWEAIKWHAHHGAKKLHLGKTSIANEGLRKFKLGWGAEEQKIEYFKFDLRKEKFVPGKDPCFGWHNRVFQSLPVSASRLIGKVLYRHWA